MLTVSMVNIGCMASMHWDMPEAMIVKLDNVRKHKSQMHGHMHASYAHAWLL